MAIEKKLIHFKKWSDFSSKKLSANEQNTQYTLGVDGALTTGAPDVLYQSICWIKDVKKMWTHGTLYDCSGGGGVIVETDPVFSASPAATITEGKMSAWDGKQDAITDIDVIRRNALKGATAVQPGAVAGIVTEEGFVTADDLAGVASSGNYNDLVDKPTFKTINGESVVGSGDITITGGSGTITGVSANGTSIATSGVANIPAASTSKYGVTKLTTLTNSSSTTLAATASAVKSAYDLAASKASMSDVNTAIANAITNAINASY